MSIMNHNLDVTLDPRTFNSRLKSHLTAIGIKARVRIVNSYKWPHCWVQVWTKEEIDNKHRLTCLEVHAPNHNLTGKDLDNVSYGNIRSKDISMYAEGWVEFLNKTNL